MLARDEQVAALRGQGTSLRQIGARLGMSLASVQLAMRRIQSRGVPEERPNLLEMYRALRGLNEWAGAGGGARGVPGRRR